MRDKRLLSAVAYTITGVWALAVIVGMFNPRYSVPAGVQAVMGILASYLFVSSEILRRRNGHGGDGDTK